MKVLLHFETTLTPSRVCKGALSGAIPAMHHHFGVNSKVNWVVKVSHKRMKYVCLEKGGVDESGCL